MSKKAILVKFAYDDGSSEEAVGDHADEVMTWLNNAQAMYCIHGAEYKGRKMIENPSVQGRPQRLWRRGSGPVSSVTAAGDSEANVTLEEPVASQAPARPTGKFMAGRETWKQAEAYMDYLEAEIARLSEELRKAGFWRKS